MPYLPLPDGNMVTVREGESPDQAWARAQRDYPGSFTKSKPGDQDKSGFKAAASAGTSRLQGGLGLLAGKLGLMDSGKAEAYNKAKEEEAAARFTPTKDSWIESPLLKLKETAGGSLPAMAATIGAGAAAATAAPLVGVGAGLAGMLGAGAASTAQFTGSNLQRQMEDGKSLDEASGAKALLTAIPQAVLDVITARAIPGLGKILGAAGKEITEEGAKAMVAQTIKEKAKDYGWSTVKLMSKEGATEAAQAVLERAQAGLSITDPEARDEYFENFMGGAALAGALGPGGRYVERGQQIAKGKQMEKDRLQKERDAAKADALRQEAGASLERGQAPTAGPVRTPSLFGVEEDGNIRPPQEEAPEPPQSPEAVAQQVRALGQLRTQLTEQKREAMAAAQTPADTLKIAEQFKAREAELAAAETSAKEQAAQQATQAAERQGAVKQLAALGAQWEKKNAEGDTEAATKLAAKLVTLEQKSGMTVADARQMQAETKAQRDLSKIGSLTRGGVSEGSLVPETSGMGPGWDRQLPGVRVMPGPVQTPAQEDRRAPAAQPQPLANDESAQGDMFIPYSGTQAPKTVTPMPDAAQQSLLDEPKIRARLSGKKAERNPNAYDPLASKTKLAYLAQRNADPSVQLEASKERNNNAVEEELTDEQERQLLRRKYEEAAREAWDDMRDPAASRPWDALPSRVQDLWIAAGERGVQRIELADRLAKLTNDAKLPAEPKKTPEAEPQRPGAAPNVLLKMANVAETRDLDPADRQLLDKLKDKMDVLAKDKNAEADARDWLYHTLMVGPSAERRAAVQETLAALDRAGMSETERTRGRVEQRDLTAGEQEALRGRTPGMLPGEEFRGNRHTDAEGKPTLGRKIKTTPQQVEGFVDTAQQSDMFPDTELQGEIFDTPEQFRERLASDEVQQKSLDTAAPNLAKRIETERKRETSLRQRLEQLALMTSEERDREVRREAGLRGMSAITEKWMASRTAEEMAQLNVDASDRFTFAKLVSELRTQLDESTARSSELIEQRHDAERTAARANRSASELQAEAAKLRDEQAPLIKAWGELKQQMAAAIKEGQKTAASARGMLEQMRVRQNVLRARFESVHSAIRAATKAVEGARGVEVVKGQLPAMDKARANLRAELDTLLAQNEQRLAEMAEQEVTLVKSIREAGYEPKKLEQKAKDKVRAVKERAHAATRKRAEPRSKVARFDENQTELERQQADGARRIEFEPAPTTLNARNAKLETIDANTDKLLDKIPDAVQEPRDPKEIARERRQQAKEAKAKRVDARTMQPSVTKKTRNDKPDVLPRNQYRGKITAYPPAGAGNAVPETTTRKLTSEEISAQIKELGEKRAQVRKNQQERIAASERNAKEARERADAKWKEIADLEANPDAKNKAVRVAKMTADARALELKANKMVQARTSNQRIVNDKREKALTAKIAELNARQEVIQRAKDRAEGKPSPLLDEEVAEIAKGQQKWMPDEARAEQTEDEARAATLKRQVGPDTRPVSSAPNKLLTGNSDANEGGVDKRIKQERGTKEAQIPIRKKEMAASNEDAERFAEVAEAKAKAEAMTDEIGRLLRVAEEKKRVAEAKAEAKQQAVFDDEGNPHFGHASDYPQASSYDYADRRRTPLRPEVVAAIKAGDITTALEELAKNASSPFLRDAAAKLVPLLDKTKIKFSDRVEHKGERVDAVYHHASNEIEMDPTLATEETLTHEAVHAATLAALRADRNTLTPEQRKAGEALEKLFNRLKQDPEFTEEYGMKNIAEFVSEVLSNPTVRDKLDAKVEMERGFLRKIYDALLGLIGIKPEGSAARATDDIYKLFQPSAQLTSGDTVASILRGVFPGNQPKYSTSIDKEVQDITNAAIGRDATYGEQLAAINSGLAWRTAIADRWAPIEALIKRGVAKDKLNEVQALQLRLNMRNHEQAGAYIGAAATDGVPQLTKDKDGLGTYLLEGKAGANLKRIGKILAGADVGNEAATEMLFTQWMAIQRGKQVGMEKLNYTRELTPAQIAKIEATVENNPKTKEAFAKAREEYKQYNTDLMNLMVDAGVITDALRKQLLDGDYVPFYRLKGNAVVVDLGTSTPVTIGNVVDQPYLKELVGGDDKILPFFSGAMQNTSLLMRTALRNLQAKDVSFMLQDLGYATIHKKSQNGSMGPEGSIRFKYKGEDFWLHLDKDAFPQDIPPELVLQGMQGIKTAMPAFVKMMSGPSNMLRKAVTRMPLYAFRQMIRDPLHAWLTTGGDFKPVLSSFQQLAKTMKGENETDMLLKRAGVISSNVMTGDEQDTARLLRDISAGKTPWNQGMAKLDEFAMAADATTRAVLYDSFRKKGMGHHEALLNTLESMNFSRRGSSASLFWLSSMIPFFNAQIQGADAVYRSLRGDTSFEGKMDARNQLLKRGAMIAGMTAAYALMMQDDEAYKNATPEERAMNWFVHTPFSDEPIRVPIPFELGLLFKALPEAAINTAFGDTTLKGAAAAIGKQLWMSTPLALPTAINPVVELGANYSFFSDQPIESQREQNLTTDQRYRPGTTEAAKQLGALGVLSPVQIEHLVRGYTGSMGITLMAIADLALRPLTGADEVPKADKKASELAVLGPLFQPTTGRGAVNEAFKEIERFQQAHQSYKKLMEEGNRAEAAAFASRFSREIALASTGGAFRQQMGEIATLKRNIAASRDMDGAQKRDQIERLKQVEIQLSNRIRQLATADE